MQTYYSKPQTGRVYYEHRKFKPVDEINDDDTVAGVVYAAAAEQVIREQFDVMGEEGGKPFQPTVIGYMVTVDDDKGEMDDSKPRKCVYDGDDLCSHIEDGSWPQVDFERKGVLCNIPVLNDLQLKELAAINRRLGHDVTR